MKHDADHAFRTVSHVLIPNFVMFARENFSLISKLGLANKLTHFHVTQQPLLPQQVSANNAQYLHINKIMFVINVHCQIADFA